MKYRRAKSNAERQAAYRARKVERGEKYNNGKSGKKPTKWNNGDFVALDGEGESFGEAQRFEVESTGKVYFAKEHRYTLLAASTGESLYNGGKRLETQSCIDFLCDLGAARPRAIFVIFAGSYDINHIFLFGFDRDTLRKLSRGETIEYVHKDVDYSIEYRARKSLTIRRGLEWKRNDEGKFIPKWKARIVIWDVWGFFQDNFITVVKKWLTENWKHYVLIKEMKALRGDFATIEQSKINAYNAAELESLVAVMDKVRDALNGMGLICHRWDGAGAIAAALMRQQGIKKFKACTNDKVINAVRCAYAGGRIEVCKIGYHKGKVYDYDINSAYPSVMQSLPCMLHGFWRHGRGNPPSGFTLVHCSYDFATDLRFYPFFYRTDKMQISFPQQGEGWYWYPEYEAALECAGNIDVIEWYHWEPTCKCEPFSWVQKYYDTRQQWVKNPTEEWQKGGEKIIKLGLNSLYGKTAQQLGGTKDKPPVYHQMEWAGYITSATRARLYRAASLDPTAVIGFATDGIFTTRPLPLELSTTKQIGAWELKEPVPDGMIIAMAGVYWWQYENAEYQHFSRGFDKDSMKTPDKVMQAWEKGLDEIDIPMHRLIGMGSAASSDTLWEMRGRFTEGMRTLRLDGKSHKRNPCDVKKDKPHLALVDLEPSFNIEYSYEMQGCSHPYPVVWLDGQLTDDYQEELEESKETGDTENI